MLIGLDFDNTIAEYDRAFNCMAKSAGFVDRNFVGGKREVRTALRKEEGGEIKWQELQGQVYGKGMSLASLCPGVRSFLEACRDKGVAVAVVSHKTRFGHYDPEQIDLREAALDWMEENVFFSANGLGLARENIYFESTREEKVARIGSLGCTHFIDDLIEVLLDPSFPSSVRRYWYAPSAISGGQKDKGLPRDIRICSSWQVLYNEFFG